MGIVLAEIVAVVGGDQREAEVFFKLEEPGMDLVLHCQALILNLEIKIVLAKNIAIVSGGGESGIVLAFH